MEIINTSLKWFGENWVVLGSLLANIVVFIKWIYTQHVTNKLGRASLAGKRYIELYIPLNNELYEVKTESFTAYKGRKIDLFVKLIREILLFPTGRTNRSKIRLRWRDFINPILSGPAYEFPWKIPEIEDLSKIIIFKRHLLPAELETKWISVIAAKNDFEQTQRDFDEAIAELVICIRKLTKETQKLLEKRNPSILAGLETKNIQS
ncbi:hypothetical protein AB4Z17_29350 [Paenibacillus sp. TAF43_2]|uniref:hypothetical protein n=1 Tax=Paenibacillus sp. TAF43_2 TaxID=3233069 RepID=UPI003F953364